MKRRKVKDREKSAYLIIAHGSRDPAANQAFFDFLDRFSDKYPDRKIQGAFLDLAEPSIPDAIQTCAEKGSSQIFVLPLMFFPGKHVKEHIPEYIRQAREQYPDIDFHYGGCLSEQPGMIHVLGDQAESMLAAMGSES